MDQRDGTVIVDVRVDSESGELSHIGCATDRAAQDDNRSSRAAGADGSRRVDAVASDLKVVVKVLVKISLFLSDVS